MRRALELAARGLGHVEPNPPVGCVLVDSERNLLGEGWHQQFGGPHAEIHALQSAGKAVAGSTAFVTLEPCCHHGKTGPCSQALLAAGVSRVVVAVSDPAPHVDGGGIAELQAAGIRVEVGLLGEEAARLIAPFRQLMLEQRPWVHAKWAMTLDGKLASRTGHSQWISSAKSRAIVHQLRGRMDAILVGSGTVRDDDPRLTARPPGPRAATRIIVSAGGRLPTTSALARTAREVPVLLATTSAADPATCDELRQLGVEVLLLPTAAPLADSDSEQPGVCLNSLLAELGRRRLTQVLVEGGSGLLGSLLDRQLIDEFHVFVAPKLLGGTGALTPVGGTGRAEVAPETDSSWHEIR
ncbi:MAG: bifunctional diaminohydroxyphosphoribosylaminopyrimidine deaminase/5-amino-6-(5-phosphoribosylamino)uracil reductase RibD, partial [Planctomycetaceae bacterium]|nr:bifunctional diaminohydroxyphosphoribosylaminopyrimidine deaminase/5-amino-6-(5-phosphoribosylamino)uracil reductase RibD [Planctomycetaceae bacterium]